MTGMSEYLDTAKFQKENSNQDIVNIVISEDELARPLFE